MQALPHSCISPLATHQNETLPIKIQNTMSGIRKARIALILFVYFVVYVFSRRRLARLTDEQQ
jgi:hypothetical protein